MVLATGYIIAIFGEIAIFTVMVFLFCFIRRGSGIGLVGTSMRAALPLHRTPMEYLQQ